MRIKLWNRTIKTIGKTFKVKGSDIVWVRLKLDCTKKDKGGMLICPVCGGFGWLWGGWFHCEFCECKAIPERNTTLYPTGKKPDQKAFRKTKRKKPWEKEVGGK